MCYSSLNQKAVPHMPESLSTPQVVRFGIFEIDLRSGELRKGGLKVRLQEKPFQILAVLLERPGELVTREELKQRLWPDGTFVDFNHGLGTAVKKLRQALGDSSDNPRFIETLPKRGFRFIGPVEGTEGTRGELSPSAAGVGEAGISAHEISLSHWRKWAGILVAGWVSLRMILRLPWFAWASMKSTLLTGTRHDPAAIRCRM
jgi:DNA-binding winged helix-turn-helix (wHTH) protein